MEPIALFSIQFTLSLAAYALIAFWYLVPRLSRLAREAALVPLLWVHAFRMVGGTILAPGAVDAGVPMAFRVMIGYGDLATAALALLALVALRARFPGRIAAGSETAMTRGACSGVMGRVSPESRWSAVLWSYSVLR